MATLLAILEAVSALIVLFTIQPDPKNAVLLGLSWKRWLILVFTFGIFLSAINFLFHPGELISYLDKRINSPKLQKRTEILAAVLALFLWLSFWFPAARLAGFADDYVRIRPLIILILLIFFQYYVVLRRIINESHPISLKSLFYQNRKIMIVMLVVLITAAGIFAILRFTNSGIAHEVDLLFPASSIMTSLQIFSAWVLFSVWQYFSPSRESSREYSRKAILAMLFIIWLITFVTWSQTPLTCTDDRPGPYPPNNICYPPIDDSVYSIGSLYTYLGEGVHNLWSSDKPLYLVFMAAGQALFGANIDHYLIWQIAVLACIPVGLFYFCKRYLGFSGALLLSLMSIIKGYNEIRLYPSVGGMNVKIENTEGLMTLVLILLAMVCFRWLQNPQQKRLAVLAGGLLGIGILVRFNPLALLPFVLGLFIWRSRRSWRVALLGSSLFIATLLLTIMPWFVTARDENGVSYYITKIREVIDLRFNSSLLPNSEIQSAHMAKLTLSDAHQVGDTTNLAADFLLHFANNEYQALAELPINLTFLSGEQITQQDVWQITPRRPLWLVDLSFENYLSLLISLGVVLLGVAIAYRRFGSVGLSPLLIQSGYFLGNAAAMTSGERYLMPVGWVTLLYFCLGLVAVGNSVLGFLFSRRLPAMFTSPVEESRQTKKEPLVLILLVTGFFLLGSSTYLVNFLPRQIPQETSIQVQKTAGDIIVKNQWLTSAEWETFIQSPNALIVEGLGYHPRVYRSDEYFVGTQIFEIMLLDRESVYVSQMLDVNPSEYFSDGSDVIVVGCKTGMDVIWNSKRVLMKTNVVIQKDHEKAQIISPLVDWQCKTP